MPFNNRTKTLVPDTFLKDLEREGDVKSFLNTIRQIESSGGKDLTHKEMETGIHSGDSAIGQYGLMPNTVDEIANRMRQEGNPDPRVEALKKLSGDKLHETVNTNPELEQKLAETLANRLYDKSGADQEKMAYKWFWGHNLPNEKVEKRNYQDSDYVKKFKEYSEKLGKKDAK